jgi:hypothetical protein
MAQIERQPGRMRGLARRDEMNQAVKDPLIDLAISCQFKQPPTITEEMLSYLEEALLDEERLEEHVRYLRKLRVAPANVNPLEICDLVLHGVRCQSPDVLARLLLNPGLLRHVSGLLRGCLEEIYQYTWETDARRATASRRNDA